MARTTDLASGLAAVQTIAGNARLKIKSFGWRRAEIECNSKTHLEQICGRAISTRNAFSAIAKQIWDDVTSTCNPRREVEQASRSAELYLRTLINSIRGKNACLWQMF
jgi:hypothetical protein